MSGHRAIQTGLAVLASFTLGLPAGAGAAADGNPTRLAAADAADATAAGSEAPAATPGGGVGQLQSITVTATKRKEDIKDVPASVSAIDGDQLAEHHVVDYDDITRTVPGISFQAGAGPGLSNIEIRGVSSTSGSATVGIYVDEVSVTVKNTYDGAVQPKLFDLDRVEVLRGPQGTLFGASSMGGTIRFITKQPDLNEYAASGSTDVSQTVHGGTNNDTNLILNVPVVPGTFALRVGLDYSYLSGYIDHYQGTTTGIPPGGNATNGNLLTLYTNDSTGILQKAGVNSNITQVARITGKYVGPDELTITPSFLYQRTASGDGSIFYPAFGLYNQDKRVAEPGEDVVTVPSLTITKALSFGDLTSVTSNFRRNFTRTTDGTYYNSNIYGQFLAAGNTPSQAQASYQTLGVISFLPSYVNYSTLTQQFSEELRLSSREGTIAGMPVRWVGGLYFSNLNQTHADVEPIPGLQSTFQQIYGFGIDNSTLGSGSGNFPGVSYAGDIIYQAHNTLNENQIAPFGELSLELTPALTATAGLRYVRATQSYNFTSGGFFAFGLPNPYADTEKFSATTPKFSLDYAVDKHTNVYATVSKGFRLGGPTGPDPANVPGGTCDVDYANLGIAGAPLKYDSDSLWSYEIGSKGRYFDNRVSLNAAVYAIRWTNIQQTVNLPTCGFSFTTNAGDASSYGTELELRGRVTEGLTLSLNAGTTHAYITSTLDPGVFQVGEAILNVPEYTATVAADYDTEITETLHGFLRFDYDYTGQSHAYYNSSTVLQHYSPAYGIANLNLGVVRDKFSLGLYAKNLFDSKKIIQYPSVNSIQEGYTVRPLTVGLTATLQM